MSVNVWQNPNVWESSLVDIDISESFGGFSETISVSIFDSSGVGVTIAEVFNGFSEIIGLNTGSPWVDKPKTQTTWIDKV